MHLRVTFIVYYSWNSKLTQNDKFLPYESSFSYKISNSRHTPDLGCKNTDKACVTTFLITSITNTLVIRYPPEFDYRPKYLTAANLRSSVVTSPGSDISSLMRRRLLNQVYNFSYFSCYFLVQFLFWLSINCHAHMTIVNVLVVKFVVVLTGKINFPRHSHQPSLPLYKEIKWITSGWKMEHLIGKYFTTDVHIDWLWLSVKHIQNNFIIGKSLITWS